MNHYEKLGVSKTATQEEIKEAYKKLVKKYHPDVYEGDKYFAEKMTKEINVAYDILSDPKKKLEYDEEINPHVTYNNYTSQTEYNYTPPKYDTPPSNYNDYRKTYGNQYNYNSRYTDYHRNKTPNSSYNETSVLEKKIMGIFNTNGFVIFFLVLMIYITLFIFSICQYSAFKNMEPSQSSSINTTNTSSQHSHKNTSSHNTSTDYTPSFPSSIEEFNVNDYISNSELYSIYSQYFYDQYETFEDFKEAVTQQLYDYYSSIY